MDSNYSQEYGHSKRISVSSQGLKRKPSSTLRGVEQLDTPLTTEESPANSNRLRAPTRTGDESWTEESVWKVCLAARICNSLMVQTYFNPDEHWQALEVAHRTVFGYGHLTWEWQLGLRSYVHPLIFAVLYRILAVLRLDNSWFMTRTPRLFQSVFAGVGDVYLYKLSYRLFGERVAQWAVSSFLICMKSRSWQSFGHF